MSLLSRPTESAAGAIGAPRPGDYFSDGRDLFCVEEMLGDRALLEDCRSGALIDATIEELRRMVCVKAAERVSESPG